MIPSLTILFLSFFHFTGHAQSPAPYWEDPNWQKIVNINPSKKTSAQEDFLEVEKFVNNPVEWETLQKNEAYFCKYPYRFQYYLDKTNVSEEKKIWWAQKQEEYCPIYHKFYDILYPEDVYLVFSSYFMNNPSSTFGHTFLRLGRKDSREKKLELFDHGVNFAANPTTNNPIFYALFGMIGQFQGGFSQVPYYNKIREYNDYESRDLWSYRLNFSQKNKKFLTQYLWEISQIQYDYYFFNKNCSYFILYLLDVAWENKKLVEKLPRLYVIPSYTIQILEQVPGGIIDVEFRPSLYKQFKARYNNLTPHSQEILYDVVKKMDLSPIRSSFLSQEIQRDILDSAMDFWEYKYPLEDKNLSSEKRNFRTEVLRERGKNPLTSPPIKVDLPQNERPDQGHLPSRFELGVGRDYYKDSFLRTSLRFAHHDPLDSSVGYPPNAQIEFGNIMGRFYPKKEGDSRSSFALERVNLLYMKSFQDFFLLDPRPSWQFAIGSAQADRKNQGQQLFIEGSLGISFVMKKFQGYAFIQQRLLYSPSYEKSKFQGKTIPELGMFYNFSDRIKWNSAVFYSFDFKKIDTGHSVRWGYSRNLATGASLQTKNGKAFYELSHFFYF